MEVLHDFLGPTSLLLRCNLTKEVPVIKVEVFEVILQVAILDREMVLVDPGILPLGWRA